VQETQFPRPDDIITEPISNPEQAPQPQIVSHSDRDWLGVLIGLVIFFVGVGLLVETFEIARNLFLTPPQSSLGIQMGQTIDITKASSSAITLLFRIILLVVMALIGSMISNRGISLYSGARHRK